MGAASTTGGISTSGNDHTCPMIGNEPNACSVQSGDSGFAGRIDEFEFFRRALTQTEIQAIYNADSVGKCSLERP